MSFWKQSLFAIGLAGSALLPAGAANAVVYCTGPGVPAGCVVRPAPVVHCTRPGYPVGCVPHDGTGVGVLPGAGAGAAGAGVLPGAGFGGAGAGVGVAPANAGGPVNRAGVR